MSKWHFYEGVNSEWHWYEMNEAGDVISASEGAFGNLDACMDNARERGFDPSAYQVHVRDPATNPHLRQGKTASA